MKSAAVPDKVSVPRRNRVLQPPPGDIWFVHFTRAERDTLRVLARSPSLAERRQCFAWMTEQDFLPDLSRPARAFMLEIAGILVQNRDNDLRWGTLVRILGSGFARQFPDELWPFIVTWGCAASTDLRAGVGCCLLEHVLQYHCAAFFSRCVEVVQGRSKRFAYTMACMYCLGQAEEAQNKAELRAFLGQPALARHLRDARAVFAERQPSEPNPQLL